MGFRLSAAAARTLRAKLAEVGAACVDLTGSWDARMRQARSAVDAVLG